jgi:hypothetical protein
MKCSLWLKDQSKMLQVPSGCSVIKKMNMELLQEIKHDLWQKVIYKLKVWILIKVLLP